MTVETTGNHRGIRPIWRLGNLGGTLEWGWGCEIPVLTGTALDDGDGGARQLHGTPSFSTLTVESVSLIRVAPQVFALPAVTSFPTGLAIETMS